MSAEDKQSRYTPVRSAIVGKTESLLGFVALIDVLGFREMVGRGDDLSLVQTYVNTVELILEDGQDDLLQFVLFSDNLVVNTRNQERDSFIAIVHACSQIFLALARNQIAVRGAIACGPFLRSPYTRRGVILAGRPIVEADIYQHQQNWVGIMLAPSVVKRDAVGLQRECAVAPKNSNESEEEWLVRTSLAVHIQRCEYIPFHQEGQVGSSDYTGFAVVPMRAGVKSRAGILGSLLEAVQSLELMKAAAPDPASQQKYSETVKFLDQVHNDWSTLTS